MEVINSNSAQLSNYEVLKHLQQLKDGRKKDKRQGQLATITYETLRYLENTPCNQQTPETITACLKALEPFNLSKNEKLMIINSPPTTALEIQLMIEESEERLTEEQVNEILKIVVLHFPHVQKVEENEDETEEA
ncbi:hypothetical protein PPYR_01148 [Photinus pyralis]|uniref:DNA-directed RNA polymerase III subunit RPC9 n=1 Tax=Photinus pyralis TaxID=7054 RepID=A0A1Y1K8S3_PHOPY|nr:DNA-directed RNA polymerase III subunit RPC9-like [Photinus pyralis]XP_031353616.1 DNA-directed RNA polymerase III subunit RPC9-like [Photinus pyralis]KAB0793912.1 hypothetical protein PPYR_13532 [Photinus pyralis]KAB0804178.1 hypothetical protein PPYR_01148 [Photinus pyralis]